MREGRNRPSVSPPKFGVAWIPLGVARFPGLVVGAQQLMDWTPLRWASSFDGSYCLMELGVVVEPFRYHDQGDSCTFLCYEGVESFDLVGGLLTSCVREGVSVEVL